MWCSLADRQRPRRLQRQSLARRRRARRGRAAAPAHHPDIRRCMTRPSRHSASPPPLPAAAASATQETSLRLEAPAAGGRIPGCGQLRRLPERPQRGCLRLTWPASSTSASAHDKKSPELAEQPRSRLHLVVARGPQRPPARRAAARAEGLGGRDPAPPSASSGHRPRRGRPRSRHWRQLAASASQKRAAQRNRSAHTARCRRPSRAPPSARLSPGRALGRGGPACGWRGPSCAAGAR